VDAPAVARRATAASPPHPHCRRSRWRDIGQRFGDLAAVFVVVPSIINGRGGLGKARQRASASWRRHGMVSAMGARDGFSESPGGARWRASSPRRGNFTFALHWKPVARLGAPCGKLLARFLREGRALPRRRKNSCRRTRLPQKRTTASEFSWYWPPLLPPAGRPPRVGTNHPVAVTRYPWRR